MKNRLNLDVLAIFFALLTVAICVIPCIAANSTDSVSNPSDEMRMSVYNDTIRAHHMHFDYARIKEYLDSHNNSFECDFMRREINHRRVLGRYFSEDTVVRKHVLRSNDSLSSNTYYVPDDYTTIQAAVDHASDGDMVIVRDGIYRENINVNKRLMIRSENGSAKTIVRSAHSDDDVFSVKSDYVEISGFTAKGAWGWHWSIGGIYLGGVEHCNITNNIVSNNDMGIMCYGSNTNKIINNIISSNTWEGIDVHNSNNNKITNNIMSNWNGIELGYSCNNEITNNTFKNDGIYIWGDEVFYYNTHVIEGNTANERPIYYYKNTNGIKVPEDAGEVILANCTDMTVENINASFSSIGTELGYTTDSEISNNSLNINLEYSNNNNICDHNILNDNNIYLHYSSNNYIYNNTILNNFDGIYLSLYSEYNNIYNNNLSNNYYGISLYSSSNNNITNNIINSNNAKGIELSRYSDNNNIANNNISNNDKGIYLWDSSNNKIRLNNFINNDQNAYSGFCDGTQWNSPKKMTYTYKGANYTNYMGNYWSNYSGSDADDDGIGDTPYNIDYSDNDNYPLMEPFEIYFVPTKNPKILIHTDKYEYTTGETMSITITLKNPTEEWQPVYFARRLDLPDYDLQYWIMIKTLCLPPDYEQTFMIPFTLGGYGISFNASWYVALLNTTTYEIISEDTADWRYVPSEMDQGETMPSEIGKEITKKVRR